MTSLVPEHTDPGRRPDILGQAASWYGTKVMPDGAAITVAINVPSMSDEMRARLRTLIRHAE